MDMIPPQAPPAYNQSAYQEASDALNRIVDLQTWLATEQALIPALPEGFAPGALASYLLSVDSYWNAPPANAASGTSRRAAVIGRIAGAARDLAVLAHQDGQLDSAALALIRSLTSVTDGNLPAGVTVRELMFGRVAYAGILIVQSEHTPDRALTFSTEHGWESFPSLIDVHAEMERRARRALVLTPDLRGVARQDLASIGPDTFVESREIFSDPFGTLVDRLIRVQRDKLRQAWLEFALAEESDARTQSLMDARFDILRLDHVFDVENVLATRHAALMEILNAQRLERVPTNVAADWRDAETGYLSTQRAVVAAESAEGFTAPLDLPAYASAAIADRLRDLGVTQAAADIDIHIDRRTDYAARLGSLQALFEGPAPEQIRLVDLAYQNIAAFEPVRLSASTSDGTPIPGLNDAAIRGLVRGIDLSSRYQAYVDSTFLSGSNAGMRREHAAGLQLAHMRLLAEEARLSYYLEEAPRSFRSDHSERGYKWVKAVLDAPIAADRARVEGHDIVARQITYQGTPLRDILAIGVRHPDSVPRIVLYTPDAPDGISFREFDDRAEAARTFFHHPAFREYLLDRLPADNARVLPNGSARAFAGERLANWVLGSSSSSAYTRTEAPFEEREVSGNFLAAAYDADVQLGLRNVRTFTRSAEQAQWAWLVDRLGNATTRRMVEDAIKGIVAAPARAAQAAWRTYDNVKAGDHAQAFVDFADFYNASLSAALPAYALGSASAARAVVGARFRVGTRLVEAAPPVQPTVAFEARFVARHVRKTGRPNRDGVFTIEGKTYIEHDGRLYGVLRDNDYATWRLARPDAGTAFKGPAIQRTGTGNWAYRNVGLRGGSGRGQARTGSPDRMPDLYDDYQAEIELAFPDPLERELVASRMQWERTAVEPSAPVSIAPIAAGQRARWADALSRARLRHLNRTLQPGTSVQGPPVDLTTSRVGGMREVPRTEAPADLWYYGKMPFKDSDLRRHRGNPGYSADRAEISTRIVGPGTNGVRVTTVPPTASIERIREAMGAPDLARGSTFSVRIDPNSLYEPLSYSWRQSYWAAGDGANAALLAPNRGFTNVFFVRPEGGGALKLGRNQFRVDSTLPPQGIP